MYAFTAAALLFTSCGGDDDEDVDPVVVTTPSFDFTASSDVTNGSTVKAAPGSDVTFIVSASKSDKNLKTVTVYEGQNIISDASRISVNGTEQTENPIDISNSENSAFTWTIVLKASTDEATNTYKVVVTDKDGLSTTLSFSINTNSSSNSAVKLYSSQAAASEAATIGSFYNVSGNTTGTSGAFVTAGTEASVDFAFQEKNVAAKPAAKVELVALSSYYLAQPGVVTDKDNFTTTTKFESTSVSFDDATYSDIEGQSTSSTEVSISAGGVYAFYNSTTMVKGIVEIVSIDSGTDLMEFNVKFIEGYAPALEQAVEAK